MVESNNNGQDDSEHILKAFETCKENGIIHFEQKNYSAFTPISMTGLSASLSTRIYFVEFRNNVVVIFSICQRTLPSICLEI